MLSISSYLFLGSLNKKELDMSVKEGCGTGTIPHPSPLNVLCMCLITGGGFSDVIFFALRTEWGRDQSRSRDLRHGPLGPWVVLCQRYTFAATLTFGRIKFYISFCRERKREHDRNVRLVNCTQIQMENVKSSIKCSYKCNRWLSKSEDDHQIIRELPANIQGKEPLPGNG